MRWQVFRSRAIAAGGGLLVALAAGASAWGMSPGEGAARATAVIPFELPTVAGATHVTSDTLFDAYSATMLVFWTTHCAECPRRLEAFQDLLQWGRADGLNVVGINFDEHPTSRTRVLAESTSPDVLHLYDPGGRVAAAHGAAAHSFTAFIVDAMGVIRGAHYEIMPDEIAALRPQLTEIMTEAFVDDEPAAYVAPDPRRPGILEEFDLLQEQRIGMKGRGRLRWMHIDTTGTGAVGANLEPLAPGATLRHRLELELGYRITSQLLAGGLIRLSNEGEDVLRSGPDYLSHAWGSVFIRHTARGRAPLLGQVESQLTGGYYRVSLTPLTLMRWDQNDTPISGGQRAQGCGVCGGEAGMAGFIRTESLEQLGPHLALEGARWDLTLSQHIDLLALYARPQTPEPADAENCCDAALPLDETYYHQDLYGLRLGTHAALPWTPDLLELTAIGLLVDEDPDQPACPESCMRDPFSSRILGLQARVPFPGLLQMVGEATRSHWRPDKDEDASLPDAYRDASAYRVRVTKEFRCGEGASLLGLSLRGLMAKMDVAWQRIGGSFYSPYSALSYESNLHGFRGSSRIDWGSYGLGLFYKRLVPIHEETLPAFAPPRDQVKTTASCWLDAEMWPGGVLMAGAVLEDRDLYDPEGSIGSRKHTALILSLEQELAPRCTLMGEMEWLDGEWADEDYSEQQEITYDYTSTVVRVMMDVEF